jgi:hypothetical protein
LKHGPRIALSIPLRKIPRHWQCQVPNSEPLLAQAACSLPAAEKMPQWPPWPITHGFCTEPHNPCPSPRPSECSVHPEGRQARCRSVTGCGFSRNEQNPLFNQVSWKHFFIKGYGMQLSPVITWSNPCFSQWVVKAFQPPLKALRAHLVGDVGL